jgi:hypothetical protein
MMHVTLGQWARRGHRGRGTTTASGSAFNVISLYNNSTGNELIVVRNVVTDALHGVIFGVMHSYGATGSNTGTVTRIMAGEPVRAGQIYVTNVPNTNVPDFYPAMNAGQVNEWPDWPVSILPPNWSLWALNQVISTQLSVSFLWEVVTASELAELGYDKMQVLAAETGQP